MKLTVHLEPCEEGGFTVWVPSLRGCISEGDTREEALANIREAIELYLEPIPDEEVGPSVEAVEIEVSFLLWAARPLRANGWPTAFRPPCGGQNALGPPDGINTTRAGRRPCGLRPVWLCSLVGRG